MEQLTISESYKKQNKYSRNERSVGISRFHIEWCSKYRDEMFVKLKYKNLIVACIRRAECHIQIIENCFLK